MTNTHTTVELLLLLVVYCTLQVHTTRGTYLTCVT